MLKKSFAFIKKGLLTETSYKTFFIFNLSGILFTALSYFFINKLFGQKIVYHLEEFGVNYFSYVLLSQAFYGYVGVGLGSFASQIVTEQRQGTLEAIFLTPTGVPIILFSMALWNLLLASLDVVIYVVLGVFLFKIDFSQINIISSLVILILTIFSFSGLGILSASFILVFKRGNPVDWITSSLEGLVSGVYFPLTILPGWIQGLAKFFPITHSIRAIELAVYKNYSLSQLKVEIGFLFLFSVLLIPLSLTVFSHSLKKAKSYGNLSQY